MRRLALLPPLLGLALGTALAPAARAQPPHADWRTLETGRFTVVYPAPSEDWARHAAARLEAVWERVEQEVGYRPPDRLTVIISDPVAQPNGAAFPFLGWPRMVLWSSPPGPESVLGHYTDWADLLLVHEGTHLVHLLRRSRNPFEQLLEHLLPVGTLTLHSPRWVTEGYATVVEGRLTGSGRPNGDLRAAILRRRAQQGQLPGYGNLNDDERWLGSSMAYLAGSAFLEWLDQKAGPGSLPKLWARMTARERRSFDDAFEGVYGDSPGVLYGRFAAELTWRSLEAERALAPVLREGELWQDLSWTTGAPAVSPAGDRLAIVLRSEDDPDELVVWSTAPDEKAEKEDREKREKIAKRDPEDVPAVRTKPLGREPKYRLPTTDGIAPSDPRFLPGGKAILFVRYEPDGDGFLHPDLFRWDLPEEEGGSGSVKRLTWQADLRVPDPGPGAGGADAAGQGAGVGTAGAPGGAWAAALRNRDGKSQVVRVDLATGVVTPITEASVEEVYDQPRVSPDGRRVAFALHREGGLWRLAVRDLATGEQTEIAPPEPGATLASPAWSADGKTLYASVGNGGYVDVWSFPVAPAGVAGEAGGGVGAGSSGAGAPVQGAGSASAGAPARVTRVRGAAVAPEPAPDGKGLFFLSLEPDGLDLRRIDLTSGPAPDAPALPADLAPAIAGPRPSPPPPFAEAAVPPGQPYGLGRQEILSLTGGSATSSGSTAELGVRMGDVVGRLDVLALGSFGGSGAPRGGALAGVLRRWPVELSLHLFSAEEEPSDQRGDLPGRGFPLRGLDLDRDGAELRAAWERRLGAAGVDLEGGVLWSRTDPRLGTDADETVAFAEAAYGAEKSRDEWSLTPTVWTHWERGDGSGDGGDGWERYGGQVGLAVAHESESLALSWRRDDSGGTFRPFQLFEVGGVGSSLLPRSALANRIRVPALPVGTLHGFAYEGQRADLQLGFFPAPLFYERHRIGDGAGHFGDWLTLAGLEWTFALDPQPIGRIPGLNLTVGVARILDSPLPGQLYEGDTRWWLSLVMRP